MGPSSTQGPDLGLLLADLTPRLFEARSIQEVFDTIGSGFQSVGKRFCAWEVFRSFFRLRYDNWTLPHEAEYLRQLDTTPLIHMDSAPVPPFLFSDRRCFRLEGEEPLREVVEAFRDSKGRRLSREAVQAILDTGTPRMGAFAPIHVSNLPWGLAAYDWSPMDEKELGLLAIFTSQIGAAIAVVRSRDPGMVDPRESTAIAEENARLVQAGGHRFRQLGFLSRIGRITTRDPFEREKLLVESLREMEKTLGIEVALGGLASSFEEIVGGNPAHPEEVEVVVRETLSEVRRANGKVHREVGAPGSRAAVHTCGFPLSTPSGVHAVLALGRRLHPFRDDELETLETACTQIGLALENADRFEETRKSLHELELLMDVGRAITSTLELDDVLLTSSQAVARLVEASHAFILLLDESTQTLVGAAASDASFREAFHGLRIPLAEDTLAPRVVTGRVPIAVEDVASAPWVSRERTARFYERSLLAVPLLVRDETIGCIVVADRRGPRRWRSSEIERVNLIAHQVGIAVKHARLFEDLRSSYSELEKTQRELVTKERLAAVGELSAAIAHEVRNPLGVIFNSLGSLRRLLRPEGDAATLLEIVGEEAERLDNIVGDLLDFAKPNLLELHPEDVGALIRELIPIVRASHPAVEVETRIADGLPTILADGRLLRQVFLNLLENGAQSMQRGGLLEVEVEGEEAPDGAGVRVEISDRGAGIPEELRDKIFQPFFTTKAKGTGLGLALVTRIVQAHRGRLEFRDRSEAGTTFSLSLRSNPRMS